MMIQHYLKISFRNLLKYRQQTIISTIGLATGFVCFALSAYWIRYERGYDGFQPNRDRIYRVVAIDSTRELGFSPITPALLSDYLKKSVPEVEEASRFRSYSIAAGGKQIDALTVDSGFFNLMRPVVVAGNCNDLFADKGGIVLSEKTALNCFGRTDVVGEEISFEEGGFSYRVRAVVKDWPAHTNFPFQAITPEWYNDPADQWNVSYCCTYILLKEKGNTPEAREKIESLRIGDWQGQPRLKLIPLFEYHYSGLVRDMNVKYDHILIFAAIGALVILCSLANFIVLYISRLRIRGKELLLRKVNGSSNGGIMLLLFTEIVLILLFAFLLGFICLEWLLPHFRSLALIEAGEGTIFMEIIGYFLSIIVVLSLVVWLPVTYYRKKVYQQYIHSVSTPENKNLFRYTSLFIQLTIALGFIFCIAVFMAQMVHLTRGDIGFERKNVCTLHCWLRNDDNSSIMMEISALSSVEKVAMGVSFLPTTSTTVWNVVKEPGSEESVGLRVMDVSDAYLDLFQFQILDGEGFRPEDAGTLSMVLNETAVARLGLRFPEERTFYNGDRQATVIGVVKDFYFESPLLPVAPLAFKLVDLKSKSGSIILKYREGERDAMQKAVSALLEKRGVTRSKLEFKYMEDEYDNFFRSERILLTLLGIMSGVCILVSLFGVYSMVSLSGEQRRKEMAVRKVNGASADVVLSLFLKEYLVITLISSVVAFSAGYVVMCAWLENYVNRIQIGAWIYGAIFLFVCLVVVVTVAGRVWRLAHMNPAEELKKE